MDILRLDKAEKLSTNIYIYIYILYELEIRQLM